ncbi:MAG: endonuclease, partial [Candidatus Marinimicrobia bacterium]|nr:endonuclease [Candidatus Neomarinimicrobiota bacterium]
GADVEPQTSDMHFLFPSVQTVNASRGNDPFADIEDSQTDKWYRLGETLTSIPTSNIDEYSEKDNTGDEYFEPRESVKGNIARANFYFYTIYNDAADEHFWNIQKETLLRWHYQDPVDQAEYDRTDAIALYQDDKQNPFVLDSTLARRMWFYDPNATVSNFVFINEVDYDQPGTDNLEFIELVGKAGTDLTPYSLEFVNGLNGSNTISIGFNGKNIPVDLGLDTLDFFVIGSANVPNVDYTPAGMTSEAVDNADNYPAGIRLLKNGVVVDEISYEGFIASFTTGSTLSVSENNESPNQSIGRNNSSLDTILWDQDDEFTVAEPSPGLINTSHGQNGLVVKVEDDEYVIPEKYQLSIFPNPFNNELTIQIPIANAGDTKISIYNIQGRLVDKYNLQNMSKGMYEFHWNAQQLSSGLYIIRVDNMNKRYINKALLIK